MLALLLLIMAVLVLGIIASAPPRADAADGPTRPGDPGNMLQ